MCKLWPLLHRIGSRTPGWRVHTFTLVICLSNDSDVGPFIYLLSSNVKVDASTAQTLIEVTDI